MDFYATLFAKVDTQVLAQFAGKTAHLISVILVLTASSPHHMEEELAILFGTKVNATVNILKDARRMDYYGTLTVMLGTLLLDAVFAHQIAKME